MLFCKFNLFATVPTTNNIPRTPGIYAGVYGGISNRTLTVDATLYGVDKTGVTNIAPALLDAFAANVGTATNVIYLPPGLYQLATSAAIGYNYPNMELRGAGTNSLVLLTNTGGFSLGTGSDFLLQNPTVSNLVVDGLSKGSTNLIITNVTGFAVGGMLRLTAMNDTNLVIGTGAGEYHAGQMVTIHAVSGNTVTIWPPLYRGYPNGRVRANLMQLVLKNTGISSLMIDATNLASTTVPIEFQQTYNCYITNVVIKYARSYHVALQGLSLFSTICRNTFFERNSDGSNGSLLLMNRSSGSLVENNCWYGGTPLLEVNGSSGNIFGYNFGYDATTVGAGGDFHGAFPGGAFFATHGPHCEFNLYEGNLAPNIIWDGYFGSTSHDTVFRNWWYGFQPGWTNLYHVALKRMTYHIALEANIVGSAFSRQDSWANTFGEPNIGGSTFHGTADISIGDYWTNYLTIGVVTNRTDNDTTEIQLLRPEQLAGINDNHWPMSIGQVGTPPLEFLAGYIGVYGYQMTLTNLNRAAGNFKLENHNAGTAIFPVNGTQVYLFFGNGCCQELDLNVSNTVHLANNYLVPGGVDNVEGSVPDSLYLSGKPGYFPTDYTWPPINPSSFPTDMNLTNYVLLPAQYRWLTGVWPEDSGGGSSGTNSGTRGKALGRIKIRK